MEVAWLVPQMEILASKRFATYDSEGRCAADKK